MLSNRELLVSEFIRVNGIGLSLVEYNPQKHINQVAVGNTKS